MHVKHWPAEGFGYTALVLQHLVVCRNEKLRVTEIVNILGFYRVPNYTAIIPLLSKRKCVIV